MSLSRRAFTGAGIAALVSTASRAQDFAPYAADGLAAMPLGQQFTFASRNVGRSFLIQVALPLQPIPAGQKLAVIYVLDVNGAFPLVTANLHMLANARMVRPTVVVAVGYTDPVRADMRMTDYAHVSGTVRGSNLGGGGAVFEAFLNEELRPEIARRFPVDDTQAVLLGHSIGSLFVASALANNPTSYAGYFVASPSLQFDPTLEGRLRAISAHGDGRRVFVSVGENEGRVAVPAAAQVASALTWPESTFTVRQRIFENETHLSVTLVMLREGLPFLLPRA